MYNGTLEKISDYKYRIPKTSREGMLVDGIVYAGDRLIEDIKKDKSLEQVIDIAFLPGIVNYSLAMPDIHWGYGMPIGGVAATDPDNGGVISPGSVGYDINCGVRLIRTSLAYPEIKDKIVKIADVLYQNIPSGVGSTGDIKISCAEEKKLLVEGAKWLVCHGMGEKEDLESCEESGSIEGAIPENVSQRAYERGKRQVGTLGSGNHFIETQIVEEIFDEEAARVFGIFKGQITIMIHSGSRGLGYQVCDDYLKVMSGCLSKYGITVPDRQLACAPVKSPEAQNYIGAMKAAANYAWANRQALTHLVRNSFEKIFSAGSKSLGMGLVYDVAHNIAKFEKYPAGSGKEKILCVHRKGATRAFGPGNKEIPLNYREVGQPVIIPGDMGRASYLLAGTKKAEEETFGSACHGAGRVSSRSQALKDLDFSVITGDLKSKGIEVRAAGKKTIIEEAPCVYKDVNEVVASVCGAGLARKVCKMKPLAVIKG